MSPFVFPLLAYGALGLAQTVSFLPPVNAYVSGMGRATSMCQSCLGVADFNGDGNPDIVYAVIALVPYAGVVLGNGDGTFRPGATFPGNQAQGRPFVGDFNGDGKPDVAISGTAVWLYQGDGAGDFGAPITVPGCASITIVADVNGDSRADLICGTSVLLSDGDGTFRAAPALDNQPVLGADFNRDGKTDLLLESGTGQFAVVLGRGDGSFGQDIPISGSPAIQTILAGDFNADGYIDLAGASFDSLAIVVLPGRGDGTFGSAIVTAGLPGPIYAASDFNDDGNLDLAAGDAILAGNGDGTFRFPVFIGVDTQACGAAAPGAPVLTTPCAYTRTGAAIADFNGDHLPDVAAAYITQESENATTAIISVLLNDSPGDGFTVTGVSSATWNLGVPPGSIVTAFGNDLAPKTETATITPPPDTLGGIRLHVRDRSHASEFLAPLLYVSPSQVNYILTSTDPYAWVGIERVGSPYVAKGMAVPIGPPLPLLDPLLYSLGVGLAAASAVTVAPDGTETPVPVTLCSGSNCASVPIDLSGSPVYLSLYGTGFAHWSAAFSNCSAPATVLPVSYTGPQTQIPGLDQINVLLPKSLAAQGEIPIECTLGAAFTNAVKINVR